MPTKEQFKELVKNCIVKKGSINGNLGCHFTSKINGNSIFLPFAGSIFGTSLYFRGAGGYHWSASLFSAAGGYYLLFNADYVSPEYTSYRYIGRTVRAVQNAE
jgi:hypothetical protein